MKQHSTHLLRLLACCFVYCVFTAPALAQTKETLEPSIPVKILNVSNMPLSISKATSSKKMGTWRLQFTLVNSTGLKLFNPQMHVQMVYSTPARDVGVGWFSGLKIEAGSSLDVEWDLKYREIKDAQMVLTVRSVRDREGIWSVRDNGYWDMFRPYAIEGTLPDRQAERRAQLPEAHSNKSLDASRDSVFLMKLL